LKFGTFHNAANNLPAFAEIRVPPLLQRQLRASNKKCTVAPKTNDFGLANAAERKISRLNARTFYQTF
jgi:hypothetical protein